MGKMLEKDVVLLLAAKKKAIKEALVAQLREKGPTLQGCGPRQSEARGVRFEDNHAQARRIQGGQIEGEDYSSRNAQSRSERRQADREPEIEASTCRTPARTTHRCTEKGEKGSCESKERSSRAGK